MEQKTFHPKSAPKTRRKESFKKWTTETFRARSKEDYAEFFTRGLDGKDAVNKVYPWLYMRALAFCFALFCLTMFVMTVSRNAISYPTVILLGGAFINIPFLILIYELCPDGSLSFLKISLVAVIGGTASIFIAQLGYMAYTPPDGYFQVVYIAFLEETAKLIPVLITIVLFKKRGNPFAGFLIGVAVGVGMSVIEDMGYIFDNSSEGGAINVAFLAGTSVIRSLSAFTTHTVWAGYCGWAFSKFRRPFLNWRFYGVFIMSMALHFLWDLTLANGYLISFLGVVFGFIYCICFTRWLVKKERAAAFGLQNGAIENQPLTQLSENDLQEAQNLPAGEQITFESAALNLPVCQAVAGEAEKSGESQPENVVARESVAEDIVTNAAVSSDGSQDVTSQKLKQSAKYSHIANVIAVVAAVIFSFLAFSACVADIGYGYAVKTYSEGQTGEIISFLQNGKNFTYDWNREFDEDMPPQQYYAFTVEQNLYTKIVQPVGQFYYYTYEWRVLNDGENPQEEAEGWMLTRIQVMSEGEFYDCIPLYMEYDNEGNVSDSLYYFDVNQDVIDCEYNELFSTYEVVLNQTVFYGLGVAITLGAGMVFVLALGVSLFAVFKLKSKKLSKEIENA